MSGPRRFLLLVIAVRRRKFRVLFAVSFVGFLEFAAVGQADSENEEAASCCTSESGRFGAGLQTVFPTQTPRPRDAGWVDHGCRTVSSPCRTEECFGHCRAEAGQEASLLVGLRNPRFPVPVPGFGVFHPVGDPEIVPEEANDDASDDTFDVHLPCGLTHGCQRREQGVSGDSLPRRRPCFIRVAGSAVACRPPERCRAVPRGGCSDHDQAACVPG